MDLPQVLVHIENHLPEREKEFCKMEKRAYQRHITRKTKNFTGLHKAVRKSPVF